MKSCRKDFEYIEAELRKEYPELEKKAISCLIKELELIAENGSLPLVDILSCVLGFEDEHGLEDNGVSLWVLHMVIDRLEENRENLKRLFGLLEDIDDLEAYQRLWNFDKRLFSEEDFEKLAKLDIWARETFDPIALGEDIFEENFSDGDD